MGIKSVPAKFRTSDGQEFTDEKAAERHEKHVAAILGFEVARKAFGTTMAETQLTADGHPFEWRHGDYWYIQNSMEWAHIRTISFWWNTEFNVDQVGRLELIVRELAATSRTVFKVQDLYRFKENAERALIAELERIIEDKRQEIAEIAARLPKQQ